MCWPKRVGGQKDADQQQEGERQDLHVRVPRDELGDDAGERDITPTAMIIAAIIMIVARAMPDRDDHRIQREHDVERGDLESVATEPARFAVGARSCSSSSRDSMRLVELGASPCR